MAMLVHLFVTRGDVKTLWWTVAPSMRVMQTLQLLEIGHCMLRLVSADAMTTARQVISHSVLMWFVLNPCPAAQVSPAFAILFAAWTLAEVTRYTYYALRLMERRRPFVITWCRYSFFIVLFPIGLVGEGLVIWSALPCLARTVVCSVSFPYPLTFTLYHVFSLALIVYVPYISRSFLSLCRKRETVLATLRASHNKRKSR